MDNNLISTETILKIACSATAALFSVRWIYKKILRVAKTKDLVDKPELRKLQKEPVPVLGGLAVFFGLMVGILLAACLFDNFYGILPVIIAASLMLYIGTIDDILALSASTRALFEALTILGLIYSTGMCVDDLHGMWGIHQFSWWIGVPFTVFASVGIINAFNMVDGVNGLSSGLCILCSSLLGTFFYKNADPVDAVLAFSFAAALAPFFMHNVFGNKSRMFIGDGGTMVMGTLISWFVICVMSHDGLAAIKEQAGNNMNMAAVLLAVASVPVMDTLRVMTLRILRHRSPFCPDKTHLHHAFIELGISHSITTLTELVIDILVVGSWYLSYKLKASLEVQLYVTIGVAILLVVGTYLLLRYHEKHDTKFLHKMQRFSVKTHMGSKHWWKRLSHWLDEGCN